MYSPTRRVAAAAFALALAAASCAGTSADTVATSDVVPAGADAAVTAVVAPPTTALVQVEGADTAEGAPGSAESELVVLQLPSVDVVDLASGQTADLGDFVQPGPTLVWFWAPN